jgi:hypothetical protein
VVATDRQAAVEADLREAAVAAADRPAVAAAADPTLAGHPAGGLLVVRRALLALLRERTWRWLMGMVC